MSDPTIESMNRFPETYKRRVQLIRKMGLEPLELQKIEAELADLSLIFWGLIHVYQETFAWDDAILRIQRPETLGEILARDDVRKLREGD